MAQFDASRKASFTGIVVPFLLFLSVGILCFTVFCGVRTVFPDIYSPRSKFRKGRPPRLSQRAIRWVSQTWLIDELTLVKTVGLDGVLFLRFLKMGCRMFAVYSLLGMGVMIVNYWADPPVFAESTGALFFEDVLLPAFTVDNVPAGSPFLWCHLVSTWLFSFLAYGYLIAFYRGHVKLKLEHDEFVLHKTNLKKIETRSIMVFGIPRELRNEIDLALYYEALGLGKVESVVLCRQWARLETAARKRAYHLMCLESILYKLYMVQKSGVWASAKAWLAQHCEWKVLSGHNPTGPPDETEPFLPTDRYCRASPNAVEFGRLEDAAEVNIFEIISLLEVLKAHRNRVGITNLCGVSDARIARHADAFTKYDRQVNELRKLYERSSAMSVGFVTFESPLSAVIASQCLVHRSPFSCMARMAPEPCDIFWPNLTSSTASSAHKFLRSLFINFATLLLIFSSTALVSTITSLVDLKNLVVLFPALEVLIKDLPAPWVQVIQGAIPAILVSAWTSSLPSFLLVLAQVQGIEAESWIDLSLLSKYFFYQLWNILIVQVFLRAIFFDVLRNPQSLVETLGQFVPKASPLLINYVILQATAVYPAQLLLVGPLALTWLLRMAPWTRSSPRQLSCAYYPSILTSINFGIAYPVPILIFVIGILYSSIAPPISFFCMLFFGFAYFVYKYLLLYTHIQRHEAKGKGATLAVYRVLIGIAIMQLTMMGLLALKKSGPSTRSFDLPDSWLDDAASRSWGGSLAVSSRLFESTAQWSGYALMVLGTLPLLCLTFVVYRWMRSGYEKQVDHIPLQVFSGVMKRLGRTASKSGEEGSHCNGVDPHGAELDILNKPNRLHSPGAPVEDRKMPESSSDNTSRTDPSDLNTGLVEEPNALSSAPKASSFSSPVSRNLSSLVFDYFGDQLPESPIHFSSSSTSFERSPSQGEDNPSLFPVTDTSENSSVHAAPIEDQDNDALVDDDFLARHLEEPMTRVGGILDTPLRNLSVLSNYPSGDASQNTAEIQHDLLDNTYLHPILVGRLPTAWTPLARQPANLMQLRKEQYHRQRQVCTRIRGQQRARVAALEAASADDDGEALISIHNNEFDTGRRSTTNSRILQPGWRDKLRAFLDGWTSWAHLSLS